MTKAYGCRSCGKPPYCVAIMPVIEGYHRELDEFGRLKEKRLDSLCFCEECEPTIVVDYTEGRFACSQRRGVDLRDGSFAFPLYFLRISCETCGGRVDAGRSRCPECLRAETAESRNNAKMESMIAAAATAAAVNAVEALERRRLEERKALKRRKKERMAKEAEEMIGSKPSIADKLRGEVEDGLWRSGAETMIDTAQELLVELLSADETEANREGTRVTLHRVLSGKLGRAVVAATAGGAMLASSYYGFDVPFVDPEVAERLAREFRVFSIANVTTSTINTFLGPLRSIAIGRFGSLVGKLSGASRTLDRARFVGAKISDAAASKVPDAAGPKSEG